MVIDTSAVISILSAKPEASRFAEAIADSAIRLLSVASLLERAIVIEARHGLAGGDKLDRFIVAAGVEIEPVTVEQGIVAWHAYRTYG